MNEQSSSVAVDAPRKILLCVTGLSPQIVTETLYALAVGRQQPFIPDEIHLLTTVEGAQRARLSLLSEEPGWFYKLCSDFDLPDITFNDQTIRVIGDNEGTPLTDIRHPDDNRCAADTITNTVRQLTADDNTMLHVSIAGGRKTMGFYLGYALSLYGRPQDELSHVLVSEEFESSWNFFYPTPYSQVIEVRNKKLADTSTAVVTLAEIPFVSLRQGLPESLISGKATFSEVVSAAQQSLMPAKLQLLLSPRQLVCGQVTVTLPPVQFAFYQLFVEDRLARGQGLHWATNTTLSSSLLEHYASMMGEHSGGYERLEKSQQQGMSKEYFEQIVSKINRQLKDQLAMASKHYEIARVKSGNYSFYGIFGVAVQNVEIVP